MWFEGAYGLPLLSDPLQHGVSFYELGVMPESFLDAASLANFSA